MDLDWLGGPVRDRDPKPVGPSAPVQSREREVIVPRISVGMLRTPALVRSLMGSPSLFRRGVFNPIGGLASSGVRRSADTLPLGCEEIKLCIRPGRRALGSVLFFDNWVAARHSGLANRCRYSAKGLSKATVTAIVGVGEGLSAEHHYTSRLLPRGVAHGAASVLHGDPIWPWPHWRDRYRPDRRWSWLQRVAAQMGPSRNAWHAWRIRAIRRSS